MYSLVFSVSFSDAFNTQWAQIMRYSLTIWTRASCSANNPWDGLLTWHQGDIYPLKQDPTSMPTNARKCHFRALYL